MTTILDYTNRRVLVSGCFSGIGRATAQLLLELGAEVHGADISNDGLPLHSFTHVDLRDAASIDAAAVRVGGPIHALFNCAGIAPGRAPLDVLKVNFVGTRRLTERLLPYMSNGGAIVNIASNGGAGWSRRIPTLMELVKCGSYEAAVGWCEENAATVGEGYSFSKEALIVWTLLISSQLITRGIRVNCTSPGAVQTPMLEEIERVTPSAVIDVMAQPIGRRSRPEEQAYPLLMLNSDAASYINGVILTVDGGFMGARALGQIESPENLGRR